MEFSERLRELREERGLSQYDLGRLVGVTDATINRYERDQRKPDYEMLIKLSNLFHVTLDYLVGRSDERFGGGVPSVESEQADNTPRDAVLNLLSDPFERRIYHAMLNRPNSPITSKTPDETVVMLVKSINLTLTLVDAKFNKDRQPFELAGRKFYPSIKRKVLEMVCEDNKPKLKRGRMVKRSPKKDS